MSTAIIENPDTAADLIADIAAFVAAAPLGNSAEIAAKLAGAATRYSPPVCRDFGRCSHAEGYHSPHKADLDFSVRFFGLRRRKDGSAHLVAPAVPRAGSAVPARTRENVAACAAVGLCYWAEAPVPNGVWAVDEHQRAHLVKVDRRSRLASVGCHESNGLAAARHVCGHRGRQYEPYEVPSNTEDLATLLSG
ncbi:hypothetical protein [Mycolicibacterium sp.]|uniref:DUF7457 domain-containing protein n=1 Tax=Mycolicibacterium sp. TaxID=2320850 RepID=UPI0035606FC0